jgi:CRP-like cAMP-binding protein
VETLEKHSICGELSNQARNLLSRVRSARTRGRERQGEPGSHGSPPRDALEALLTAASTSPSNRLGCELDAIESILVRHPRMATLSEQGRRVIAQHALVKELTAGDVLYSQSRGGASGPEANGIFVVISGLLCEASPLEVESGLGIGARTKTTVTDGGGGYGAFGAAFGSFGGSRSGDGASGHPELIYGHSLDHFHVEGDIFGHVDVRLTLAARPMRRGVEVDGGQPRPSPTHATGDGSATGPLRLVCVALERTKVLHVTPMMYSECLDRTITRELRIKMKALKASPHFCGWDPSRTLELARLCDLRHVPTGGSIFKQGDTANEMLIVVSGEVSLFKLLDLDCLPIKQKAKEVEDESDTSSRSRLLSIDKFRKARMALLKQNVSQVSV